MELLVSKLKTSDDPNLWKQLQNLLSDKSIDLNSLAVLESFLRDQCLKPKQSWFRHLSNCIKSWYSEKRWLLKIIYRLLPVLMMNYIQINFIKYESLQDCLVQIYNNQFKSYNQALLQKNELPKLLAIRTVYQKHLGKQIHKAQIETLLEVTELNNTTRNKLKNLIFYIIYREASKYNDQSRLDYYRALFIYCGADQKDLYQTGSLFLLEKTNKVSIFKYSITEDQLQWIILTLFELCTQTKKDKFELLSVINVIHKKVSNECLFRMSQIANSLIHLLEDEYSEIFA